MDKDSKSSFAGQPGNGWIVVALLITGVLVWRGPPLESSRPVANEPLAEQRYAEQDIDARLWQDPLGAVARAREAARKKDPGDEARREEQEQHSWQQLQETIKKKVDKKVDNKEPAHIVVLAVLLSSGPYPDYVESRRRTRHAVLSGLNVAKFVPVDTEHLGYFFPSTAAAAPSASAAAAASAPAAAASASFPAPRRDLPQIVPYEWFAPAPDDASSSDHDDSQVLVLWLDSGAFSDKPFHKLTKLASQLHVKRAAGWPPAPDLPRLTMRWHVIGPIGSDGLKAMVDEANDTFFFAEPLLNEMKFRFYSNAATVPDRVLLHDVRGSDAKSASLEKFFEGRGVTLLRTIGDDEQLAKVLVNELELRGLKSGGKETAGRDICRRRSDGSTPKADEQKADEQKADEQKADEQKTDRTSRIAIVAEWDTLYGRSMRRHFEGTKENIKEWTEDGTKKVFRQRTVGHMGFCVLRWHYMRGLDGRLPDEVAAPPPAATKGDAKSSANISSEGTFVERPEGQNQLDYLRRLALQIRARDETLRSEGEAGIRAIGVLGNDVYDKLLVLQALRPVMPDAIFFTTDLDTRFTHPRELPATRNLIVASHFGLRLREGLQRGTPPFRDNYQTSAFLSTQLALEDARRAIDKPPFDFSALLKSWLGKPRIFEVSRTRAFDFGSPPDRESEQLAARAKAQVAGLPTLDTPAAIPPQKGSAGSGCWRGLAECLDLHPDRDKMSPQLGWRIVPLLCGAAMLAVWPLVLLVLERWRRWKCPVGGSTGASGRGWELPWLGWSLLVAVGAGVLIMLVDARIADWLTADGKPLVFNEGISTWPSRAIRWITLLVCFYLLLRGAAAMERNLDEIQDEFKLEPHHHELIAKQEDEDRKRQLTWPARLRDMFQLRYLVPPDDPPSAAALGVSGGAITFWKHYIVKNRPMARMVRTLACVLAMTLLGLALREVFDYAPTAPQRAASFPWDIWVVPVNVLLMQVLLFSVADVTLLCVTFVRGLREQRSVWPPSTLQVFERRLKLPGEYLDDWIDLQFIARRTARVDALIYYPFIALSLVLLARSPFFDDWQLPRYVLVLLLVGVAIVAACVVALRRVAEHSRRHAMKVVGDALILERGKPDSSSFAPQLELLLRRIEDLREGAFEPFSSQPLLKAVMLPFATFGGTALLDYIALANL